MDRSSTSTVAIIGAGPYGISIAAHLRCLGVDFRIFGRPMDRWRSHMPKGMFLKSEGLASNLSDPAGHYTLKRYCIDRALPYGEIGTPVSLDTFVRYALSFQEDLVPTVEDVRVTGLDTSDNGFAIQLNNGSMAYSTKVIVATGLEHTTYIPPELAHLPPELCSHAGQYADVNSLRGKDVIIIGAGQSALETAALLSEAGASVRLVLRKPSLTWNPVPQTTPRPLYQQLRRPMSGLGEGLHLWLYSNAPQLFRYLPQGVRLEKTRNVLSAAGAWWLRDRVEKRLEIWPSHIVQSAEAHGGRVVLRLAGPQGRTTHLATDHVIAATGFRFDLERLPFLSQRMKAKIQTEQRRPRLSAHFESSVAGLYFTGFSSADSFGPAMRFLVGTGFTAQRVSRHIASQRRSNAPAVSLPRLTMGRSMPAVDQPTPALVFKIGSYIFHHGTLGVVRSLGRLGVPVYAVVEDRFSPVAMSRYLKGAFVWQNQGLNYEHLIYGLKSIGERLGRPAVLIPTDDQAAVFVAEHQGSLERWFLIPRVPKDLPRQLSNKRSLYHLCGRIGLPCQYSAFPLTLSDVQTFAAQATFPVMIKAMDACRLEKGSASTSIAWTPAELFSLFRRMEIKENPNVMLQEYIPQAAAEDWVVHGYWNSNVGCRLLFTGKKLRSWPPYAGITALGVSAPNDPLRQQTERLLDAIGYVGLLDLDYRLDKRDGQYKLLDFNPRIGANFRMFENSAGVDVVRALHLDLSGKAVSLAQAVEGRKFLVENCDLLASMGYMRRGDLSIGSWWRSLQGKKEFAWFSMDDPDPFLSMFVRQGTVLTALACRKLWRHVFSPTARHNRSPAGVLSSPVLEVMQEPASKQPVAR